VLYLEAFIELLKARDRDREADRQKMVSQFSMSLQDKNITKETFL
jgi:hypothetical protein